MPGPSRHVNQASPRPPQVLTGAPVRVRPGVLGECAVAIGAATLARDRLS